MLLYLLWFITYIIINDAFNPDAELLERTININTVSPKILAHLIADQIHHNGLIFLNNTFVGNNMTVNKETNALFGLDQLSEVVTSIPSYYDMHIPEISLFDYTLGNVAGITNEKGKEIAKGINKVSGAPKQTLVLAHSEASYLPYCPLYLVFACPGTPNIKFGGQTIVYPIDNIISRLKASELGRNLMDEVAKYGVIYIRNDVDQNDKKQSQIWKNVNYPFWQNRFDGYSKTEINDLLLDNNQTFEWITNENVKTLRTEWKMSGFRLHPIKEEIVWFNQLYGMNGRYFDLHNVDGMDKIPLNERPLHTKVGNGRELSTEEFNLLHLIHEELAILIPWDDKGDIMAIDNFQYQHGRMPFDSYRNCVINWGPAVMGKEYVYDERHFGVNDDLKAIKEDLWSMHALLDKFRWFDTLFYHVSYRLKDKFLDATDGQNIFMTHQIPKIYQEMYQNRDDVNVILHVSNADIATIGMLKKGFLPIDQSYYMLYPVTHYFDAANESILKVLGRESKLLLMQNNGIIVLGTTIDEAFTRFFYAIRAAQSQVLAMSIVNDNLNELIFPSAEIQKITIDQTLNFNDDGYGYLEFKAWKRRFLSTDDASERECVVKFSTEESELRRDVAKAYHILDELGWIETIYQHITAKIMGDGDDDKKREEAMLINAYGLEFGEVTADNLMKVTMNGTVLFEGDSVRAGHINPAGLALHAAVHGARDDAKVVIHCHHAALSAISVIDGGIDENMIDIGYRELIGNVVYHSFDTLSLAINKEVLREELSNGSNVIILRNHGILAIGETVEDAFNRLFYTIQSAETQIKMMTLPKESKVQKLDNEEMNNEREVAKYANAWKKFQQYMTV